MATIPTMILFGLLLGLWWRICLPLAAVVWPAVEAVGPGIQASDIPWAAGLGLMNAAVGVAALQGGLVVYRGLHVPPDRQNRR